MYLAKFQFRGNNRKTRDSVGAIIAGCCGDLAGGSLAFTGKTDKAAICLCQRKGEQELLEGAVKGQPKLLAIDATEFNSTR